MTTETKKSGKALKIILPLLVLLLGAGGFVLLGKLKQTPQRQAPPQRGVLVDVMELKTAPHQIRVYATGTVQAARQIALVPEITGKVVWIAPQLVDGGFFQQGETLLKIEPADYRLAVERAQAEIARAQVTLTTEQERSRVALQEWQRVDLPDKGEPGPLVSREIQQQQEQANLAAALATLEQAQLNLQRTELKAPFNGRIRQKQVDLGQYLRAGTSIGNLAGTDRAEIHVPLPLDDLRWLQVPAAASKQPGSLAMVYLPGDSSNGWQGQIIRSLGEIDPTSRMATAVIAVDDPYQLRKKSNFSDLSNGQFVEIQLFGDKLDSSISIPRTALRNDSQVWVADSENRLRLRPVEILRREKQQLIIKQGLSSGEKLVLTGLSGAADGLLLRPVQQEQQP
jgi:RND family efflux transporter MFP subunit